MLWILSAPLKIVFFSVFEIKFQLCARERGTPKKIGSLLCMFLYTVQVRLCRTMFWFSYCVPLKMAQSQNSHLAQKPCEKLNIWKFITLCQINSKQCYWYHWNQNKKICWEIPPFYLSVQFKKSLWSTYFKTTWSTLEDGCRESLLGVCVHHYLHNFRLHVLCSCSPRGHLRL